MAAGEAPPVELSNREIQRYGRQMILPEWGKKGQLAVKRTSVLIVGCGGLGCPAAQYLAASGIGHIGLVDYDRVELGNLHRQILHSEERIGGRKSELNTEVDVTPYHLLLDSSNALNVVDKYDIILDCTDNVATRYLLNDSCVLTRKPLVSGSALRFEGQLTVYNHCGGPCYRCIFPTPPPPETVTNCSDGGVLGVVPGIVGSLQALEALKIAAGRDSSYSGKLLLFDGLAGSFRTIRLRERRKDCAVCGDNPTVLGLIDYPQFCGSRPNDKDHPVNVLDPRERLTCQEYKQLVDSGRPHVLLDVREAVQYEICSLPNSINLPLSSLQTSGAGPLLARLSEGAQQDQRSPSSKETQIVVVCRRGNDSQLAVRLLQQILEGQRKNAGNETKGGGRGGAKSGTAHSHAEDAVANNVRDIAGGLDRWSQEIDSTFPQY